MILLEKHTNPGSFRYWSICMVSLQDQSTWVQIWLSSLFLGIHWTRSGASIRLLSSWWAKITGVGGRQLVWCPGLDELQGGSDILLIVLLIDWGRAQSLKDIWTQIADVLSHQFSTSHQGHRFVKGSAFLWLKGYAYVASKQISSREMFYDLLWWL